MSYVKYENNWLQRRSRWKCRRRTTDGLRIITCFHSKFTYEPDGFGELTTSRKMSSRRSARESSYVPRRRRYLLLSYSRPSYTVMCTYWLLYTMTFVCMHYESLLLFSLPVEEKAKQGFCCTFCIFNAKTSRSSSVSVTWSRLQKFRTSLQENLGCHKETSWLWPETVMVFLETINNFINFVFLFHSHTTWKIYTQKSAFCFYPFS